jgi:Bacterial Ig-like domain (group 3)
MRRLTLLILLALLIATPVIAVSTSHWTQDNEADFKPGTFHNVVVTNLGDLKLSRAVTNLLEQDPKVSAVYSLAADKDGTVYAGTGPQGVLLQIKADKISTIAQLEDGTSIFSLLVGTDGAVFLGTGGSKGEIYKIDKPGDKPHSIFQADGVQYVWAMVQTSDGNIYAATGPTGQLFEIKPDASHTSILTTKQNNLLSMISDGGDMLYIGSDPNGLVYRFNRKTHDLFVLYDAGESEISALALDSKGDLYVGTAQASEPPAAAADTSESDDIGRPEGGPGGVPIQAEPPANPKPPAVPKPNPGQPDPIPDIPKKMMIMADDPPDPGQPTPPAPAPPGTPQSQPANAKPGAPLTSGPPPVVPTPAPAGNAIYKIDTSGFVTEIFRQQVMIYSIVEHAGTLLVGTGNDGMVYQIDPDQDETVVIARVDPKQVTSLLPTSDGRIILGLSNAGGLAVMDSGYASTGTYVSPPIDATQISQFGKIELHGSLPAQTSLTVSTRSGNVKEASEAGWSNWSDEQPASQFVATNSPPARLLQYRLTFSTKAPTTSPVVRNVDVAYLMPNLPPQIKSIKVTVGGKSTPPPPSDSDHDAASPSVPAGRIQTIVWDATDPNEDPLVYTLYYRTAASAPWILLKNKLHDATYEWDTRSVPDGRYQIKVVASDAAANPIGQGKTTSRISDSILVDNTPPVMGDITTQINGGDVIVKLRAADRTSIVAAVDYAVDSALDWQSVASADKMFDSPTAEATFTVPGLSPGTHQIVVRATDARGNQGFENVTVVVAPPK